MNRMFLRLLLVGLFISLINGCALNKIHFQKYYQAGNEAEERHDYEMAKKHYYRAWDNARMGRLEPQLRAQAAYSLGRMLGIFCDDKNAELMLKEALNFDKESYGPVYMSLFELAYLNYDQGKYDEAVSYFQQAIPLIDNEKYIEFDPAGFVMHFSTYSRALEKTGHSNEAKVFNDRANVLSKKYPAAQAKDTRTPYNRYCNKTNSLDNK